MTQKVQPRCKIHPDDLKIVENTAKILRNFSKNPSELV